MSFKKFFNEPSEHESNGSKTLPATSQFYKAECQYDGALSLSSIAASSLILTSAVKASQSCDTDSSGKFMNISGDKPNSWSQITRYNNYYEFSTSKEAIVHLAQELTIKS